MQADQFKGKGWLEGVGRVPKADLICRVIELLMVDDEGDLFNFLHT